MYGIVVSEFNPSITKALLKECLRGFKKQKIEPIVVEVPGAAEIPYAAQDLIQKYPKIKAIVALGSVIKGDTDHYEHVCRICSEGISQVSLKHHVPIVFEVLMTQTTADAKKRTLKGYEAAFVATHMANL